MLVTREFCEAFKIEEKKGVILRFSLPEYHDFAPEQDVDIKSIYSRADYFEGEDGELSSFDAGVRGGVGLGLGICLGIGVGVGLLVRTYQNTTRNFKRRLI